MDRHLVSLMGLYALDQGSSSHPRFKIRPYVTMQTLLGLTAASMSTVQGMRFACTSLADWCRKYSPFDI